MKFQLIIVLSALSIIQVNQANRFSTNDYQPPMNYEQNSVPPADNRFERGAGLKRLQRIRAKIQSISQRSQQNLQVSDEATQQHRVEPMHNASSNPFYKGNYRAESNNPFANKPVKASKIDSHLVTESTSVEKNSSQVPDKPRAKPTPAEDRIIKLLTKCEKLGPFMNKKSEQGDKARELYGKHCNVVIEQLALKERLDVFYRIHGTYLAMMGRHQDANTYLTHYYQVAPQDFESNYLMIQNLADLGHSKMAVDMLTFFRERNQHRNFSITQQDKLQKLQHYAQSTQ